MHPAERAFGEAIRKTKAALGAERIAVDEQPHSEDFRVFVAGRVLVLTFEEAETLRFRLAVALESRLRQAGG